MVLGPTEEYLQVSVPQVKQPGHFRDLSRAGLGSFCSLPMVKVVTESIQIQGVGEKRTLSLSKEWPGRKACGVVGPSLLFLVSSQIALAASPFSLASCS